MIPDAESLAVEFKSDRGPLPDRELIETAVCLANSEGGEIYLDVEDDESVILKQNPVYARFMLAMRG